MLLRPFIRRRSCSSPLIPPLLFDVSGSLRTCQKCSTLAQFLLSSPCVLSYSLEGRSVEELGFDFLQERECCLPEIKQMLRTYQVSVCFTSRIHSIDMGIVAFVCDQSIFISICLHTAYTLLIWRLANITISLTTH